MRFFSAALTVTVFLIIFLLVMTQRPFPTDVNYDFDCPGEPSPGQIKEYVERYSEIYGVEKAKAMAIMAAETSFEHCFDDTMKVKCSDSVPPSCGIMQVWAENAKPGGMLEPLGITDPRELADPETNIKSGIYLFSIEMDMFEGYDDQTELAVGRYNCGEIEAAVEELCGLPENKEDCWEIVKSNIGLGKEYCNKSDETLVYVPRVMRLYECYKDCLETYEGDECYSMDPCQHRWYE